jgi:hypothetical protein
MVLLDLLPTKDFILLDDEDDDDDDDDATDARDEDAEVAQANMIFIRAWSFLFLLKTRAQIDMRRASLRV